MTPKFSKPMMPCAFRRIRRIGFEDDAVASGIMPGLLVPRVIKHKALAVLAEKHLVGDLKADFFAGLRNKEIAIRTQDSGPGDAHGGNVTAGREKRHNGF